MKTAIRWAVLNFGMTAVLWFGLVEHVEGARNLGLFLAWLTVVSSLMVLDKEIAEAMRGDGYPVPMWLELVNDVFIVGLLAWHGQFPTAVGYAAHIVLLHGAMNGHCEGPPAGVST